MPQQLRARCTCESWLLAGSICRLDHGRTVYRKIVQKAMGHASLKTTMHYYDYVREDLRHLVEEQKADEERSEVAALI